MLPKTIKTKINTKTGPIKVKEFSYFLYLFRAVYVVALKEIEKHDMYKKYTKEEIQQLVSTVNKNLKRNNKMIYELSFYNLPENQDLTIIDIHRENPLDVLWGGIPTALTIAVILSGGKFKGLGIEVELPPLGTGIKSLREALGYEQPSNQLDNDSSLDLDI